MLRSTTRYRTPIAGGVLSPCQTVTVHFLLIQLLLGLLILLLKHLLLLILLLLRNLLLGDLLLLRHLLLLLLLVLLHRYILRRLLLLSLLQMLAFCLGLRRSLVLLLLGDILGVGLLILASRRRHRRGLPVAQIVFGVVEDLSGLVALGVGDTGVAGHDGRVVEKVEQTKTVTRKDDLLLGALDGGEEFGSVGFFEFLTGL